MFEFSLRPLDEIQPWSRQGEPWLSWFGLTDGTYFLQLGADRLLAYAPRPGWPEHVDYQIARLHEDLLDMVPDVRSSIPAEIAASFVNGSLLSTRRALQEMLSEGDESDPLDEDVLFGLEQIALRRLDTGYLTPGFNIGLWSCDDEIVIEWDNRDQLVDGTPAWTAQLGTFRIPEVEFVANVRDFHRRFIDQMGLRVDDLFQGPTPHGVAINLDQLRKEQARRDDLFEAAMNQHRRWDWQPMKRALDRLAKPPALNSD